MQVAKQIVSGELAVSEALLEKVLKPYKPHCRYLKRAQVVCGSDHFHILTSGGSEISARGEFEIPESCYIASTGHFNAVEFNICYNQLAYTLLAASIEHKLMPSLAAWSLEEYRHRQLSDFVILDFSSEFRAAMQAEWFEGFVSIDKVTVRRGTLFMKTSSQFQDGKGGLSTGGALIAILNGARHSSTEAVSQ